MVYSLQPMGYAVFWVVRCEVMLVESVVSVAVELAEQLIHLFVQRFVAQHCVYLLRRNNSILTSLTQLDKCVYQELSLVLQWADYGRPNS